MPDNTPRRAGMAFLDGRGALQVQPFRSSDDEPDERPVLMVELTPPVPSPRYFALDADEARALAAELIAMADDLDAGRWPDLGEPGV